MKKTLMFVMVAMLAITSIFAAEAVAGTTGNPGTGSGKSKSVTASLELGNADFVGYNFGFSLTNPELGTSVDNDVSNITDKTAVTIAFKSAGAADSTDDPIYYYYKVRAKGTVRLTMTADLLKKDGAESNTLKYSITGGGTNFKGKKEVNDNNTTLMTVDITDDFGSDKGLMTFNVTGLNAGNIGKYNAAITYKIVQQG